MSNSDTGALQAPKPSRLSGLVAPKGAAARPGEVGPAPTADVIGTAPPQPGTKHEPHATPTPVQPASQIGPPIGTGSKSLTLRLPDAEYERLRSHAFVTRKTHQTILAEALRQYLDKAATTS